jgi:hypothetical protein
MFLNLANSNNHWYGSQWEVGEITINSSLIHHNMAHYKGQISNGIVGAKLHIGQLVPNNIRTDKAKVQLGLVG